ncbi:MAG: hypothetical protein WCK29_02760 [archaeon]
MKKSGKLLSILLLGLVLSVSFSFLVSAAVEGFGNSAGVPQVIKDAYHGWSAGVIDPGFAKILIFVLILLIVFLILENINLFGEHGKNNWIVWTISAVIALLATAYLVPAEVLALLISYSALGLTLTTLIPLALLIGFSFRAARSGNSGLIIIQLLTWIIFGLYMIYKAIYVIWIDTNYYSAMIGAIVIISTALAIFAVFGNNTLVRIMSKAALDAEDTAAQNKALKAVKRERQLAKEYDELAK